MASRTKNAVRNIFAATLSNVVRMSFPFLVRAIIIQVLGADYLGLSSLFTSILQVLNLTEMGFSSAVICSMYKPVADKDEKTIRALMNLYKRVYRVMGIVILIVGLAIMPFLPNLIDGSVPEDINIYILYSIYLLNTVLSYTMFAYKGALINAHQRNDMISNVYTITSLVQYIIQIAVLLITKNFYLYVIVQCATTILNNVSIAIIAKRKYPRYFCEGKISNELRKDIRKKVAGLMIQKICTTTRNSLDSVFISAMIGLTAVAIYSNYYTIMASIIGVMGILTSSIVSSVGNSIVTESEKKNHDDMNRFNFIYMWLSGWLTVCLACLYQPLMKLWMGEDLMFPYEIVVLFCVYFYSLKMGDIRAVYADAKGLWYESRYRAIAESVMNVVLNLVLGHFFGVAGIIAGTLISLLIINFGYGSQILFKHYFKSFKVSEYFLRHGMYALVTLAICVVTFWICSVITIDGFLGLILKGLVCVVIPNVIYYVAYHKTVFFKESVVLLKKIFTRRRKKTNSNNK